MTSLVNISSFKFNIFVAIEAFTTHMRSNRIIRICAGWAFVSRKMIFFSKRDITSTCTFDIFQWAMSIGTTILAGGGGVPYFSTNKCNPFHIPRCSLIGTWSTYYHFCFNPSSRISSFEKGISFSCKKFKVSINGCKSDKYSSFWLSRTLTNISESLYSYYQQWIVLWSPS